MVLIKKLSALIIVVVIFGVVAVGAATWRQSMDSEDEEVTIKQAAVEITKQPTTSSQVAGEQVEFQEVKQEVKAEETNINRRIKLGVVVDDYSNRLGALSSLEEKMGSKFDTVSIYKQFGHEFNNHLVSEDLMYIKSNGKKLLVAWEPWDPRQGMSQSRDYLAEITNGSLDGYINQFADEVMAHGNSVIIRFGHEMNGNWYPWGGRAEEYVKAYRYLVDKFRSKGVSNVEWMWSINAESVPVEPIGQVRKYYPGNEYVNVIGIDGFNFGSSGGNTQWRTFSQIFSPAYSYLNQNYSQPIMISETASAEEGGNKAVWIEEMKETLNGEMVKVDQVVWFNLLKEADWRMESTDASLNSWRNIL